VQRKYKRIEFFWNYPVRNLAELPGLIIQKDQKTTKVEVLKKVLKVYDREEKKIKYKTAYITDPKQIKQYKKRKSKKEVREAKRKGGPSKRKQMQTERFSEEGSFAGTGTNKMIIRINKSSLMKEESEEENFTSRAEEPLTIKLNLGDVQQVNKGYMQDFSSKAKSAGSRKRQNNPEKQFNDLLEEIIDSAISVDEHGYFRQPVTKKIAPDYHLRISNPMDLGSMKTKAKKWLYKDIETFKRDIELIRSNAEEYNGMTNFIAHQGRRVEEHVLELIKRNEEMLKQSEDKMRNENIAI